MSTPQEENVMALEGQVKKLQTQKNTLIRELDTVEERFESMNLLYSKYLPPVIDSLNTGNTPFSKSCSALSSALKKRESEGKIEYIFQQLKTAILKEDVGDSSGKKKKGLFSSFMKGAVDPFVDEYRQSYHDVVNNLRSNIDEKYHEKLTRITGMVKTAGNTSDFSDIREKVFKLIFTYISETGQEREKVNSFVKEIVEKILGIESILTQTYQQTDSMFQSNDNFESVLNLEMQGLQNSSDVAASLEALKAQVSERLSSIESALVKKQVKDRAIKKLAGKNRNSFKSGFKKLRQELDEATRYSEELEKKLNQDQLTGAFNRRAYDKRMEEEMDRFSRYGNQFSLLIIDADKFKLINDNYGHAIGDKCLKEIIKRTMPLLRKTDMLARYGGEEFAVIMAETKADGAKIAAEKIRKTIEKIEFIYKKEKVRVTVSIGVSQSREGDKSHLPIFERADIAVYQAKEQGRNRVVVSN